MNRLGLLHLCFRISLLGLTFTLAACSSMRLREPHESVTALAGGFKVHQYSLNNGLRLLVVEDHSSPTFAYQTWFRVGSRDETPGKTGLAHLFEHMMFKETRTLKDGEFDRILEQEGAQGENAFTSRDYTTYIEEMPKSKLELVARLESDRMVNLIINDSAFRTEREVVQNERRYRNENNPDGLMDQELYHLAFEKHPYHWPIIGFQEDLNRMTSEDAMKFYHSYYSPSHATVVVVGDVEPEEVRSTIEKYYGHLPRTPENTTDIPAEPDQTHPRRKILPLNIQVQKLNMAYHAPEIGSPDTPALEALQIILGGGKTSRLHQALVETGIASSVVAYNSGEKDPSLFVIDVNLQKNRKADQAEAIVLKQIWKLMSEGVTAEELDRAKNKINFGFYQNLEGNYSKAQFLGHFDAVAGDFRAGLKLYEEINRLTPQDIVRVAKKYLQAEKRTVVMGIPKKGVPKK